ncbi:hypothetical protein NEOLI_004387 [Neolecta irregularis DAH-3]|uniref:Uncharacterized protein n=1 Tax=Neolecta irregularis (strain DAH-3) TaxID=1198029 RepID=A0A1U7LPC8_NEOID|nr:hypothetical protein NEOLI_004387 [Neolecta irregularis DAH-3]|eukprot:OLL24504.1 hypothetical protein NEOLI_004387 [Neolecta irregularis DAH-3]
MCYRHRRTVPLPLCLAHKELLSTSLAYHFPKATSPESTNSQSLQKGRAISPTAQDVEEGNFHRLATYLKENFNITADCAQEEGRLYSGEEVRQRVRSVGGERIAEAKTKEQLKELLGMQE